MFIHIAYNLIKGNPKEIERFLNSSTYLNASETEKMIYRVRLGISEPNEKN